MFFFQAEDGIRDLVRSRGLGDVYKRQPYEAAMLVDGFCRKAGTRADVSVEVYAAESGPMGCLLYTSDAADERSSVDLGGRRFIQKKKKKHN